jgi:hypothetical protein
MLNDMGLRSLKAREESPDSAAEIATQQSLARTFECS